MDGLMLDAPVQYLVEMHHLTLELQMWAFTHTLYAAQGLCGGSKLLVQSRTYQLHDLSVYSVFLLSVYCSKRRVLEL